MPKRQAEAAQDAPAQERSLVEQLGLDPKGDTARWIAQQEAAGVKRVDILFSLSEGNVSPARYKRVPIDDAE